MKKSLLLLSSFCFYTLIANAQITITTADIVAPQKVIHRAKDMTPTISFGSAGTNQTWDMSALNTSTRDTLTFLSYSSAPNANFSTATLALKQGFQNFYSYLNNSASGLIIQGSGGDTYVQGYPANLNQINTPAEIVMNFPATFGSASITNNYKSFALAKLDTTLGADSARQKTDVKKIILIDAWGTLTTPYGTNIPVLRFKETKITHDTLDVHGKGTSGIWFNNYQITTDSITTYTWWGKSVGYPLVTITVSSTGAITSVEWITKLSAVGINEYVSTTNVNVYPNPAQNEITFEVETSKAAFIRIVDITGRVINTTGVKNDQSLINTSSFANGIYTYSIIGENNEILHQGKFSVSK